jgi:hypothetical protein
MLLDCGVLGPTFVWTHDYKCLRILLKIIMKKISLVSCVQINQAISQFSLTRNDLEQILIKELVKYLIFKVFQFIFGKFFQLTDNLFIADLEICNHMLG